LNGKGEMMNKHAQVVNNVATNVIDGEPTAFFHPDIATGFVPVPDQVENGWVKSGTKWNAPVPAEPVAPEVVPPKVGPIHFQMLFTAQEAAKANELRATDAILSSFWKLIDDPRTDTVDLSLTGVQDAIGYTLAVCKQAGVDLDVQMRKAAILTGVLR
jgi:hypothetical protein